MKDIDKLNPKLIVPTTREQFLKDMIQHFNIENRGVDEDENCYYQKGCAIGRYLSKSFAKRLDGCRSKSPVVCFVFDDLPPQLQALGKDFLREVQLLHDNPDFWNKDGISKYGIGRVRRIVDDFKLSITQGEIRAWSEGIK